MCLRSFILGALFMELLVGFILWGMTPRGNFSAESEYEYTFLQNC